MISKINNFIKTCEHCQRRKTPKNPPLGFLNPIPPNYPFHTVGIDILGPFPKTKVGNAYIIVAIDLFTKWLEIEAVPDATAITVANFLLYKIISKHGAPLNLLSDRGVQFLSKVVAELCKLFLIKKINTTPYHPQCNGQTERQNSTILNMISAFVNESHDDWDEMLDFLQFSYNTATHDSTNYSPFFLNHGREAVYPDEVTLKKYLEGNAKDAPSYVKSVNEKILTANKCVKSNIKKRQARDKFYFDKGRKEPDFKIGDLVSVYRPTPKPGRSQKLLSHWQNNFVIKHISKNKLVYTVENRNNGKTLKVNVNNIKRYFDRNDFDTVNAAVADNLDESEIQQIEIQTDTQMPNEPMPNQYLRRSTRERRPPKHLKDFVT
ncbi:integrase core domain protein-like protein [Dinothrombium tinctorium]|uniref:Integrase core domain protein-like protein n=1 Tax=Dinothrombium tinctorium TaxID=1965070 RepID=A0A443QK85_9ACAR|nr:integrase core domain protein-like protein [Dinothrombium tinctorium]